MFYLCRDLANLAHFRTRTLWLRFFHNSCKFVEKSASCIFKSKSMSYHRKSLTRSSAYDEINFIFVFFCVKIANIEKPIFFFDWIVCKITLFAFRFNISCEYNLMIQS